MSNSTCELFAFKQCFIGDHKVLIDYVPASSTNFRHLPAEPQSERLEVRGACSPSTTAITACTSSTRQNTPSADTTFLHKTFSTAFESSPRNCTVPHTTQQPHLPPPVGRWLQPKSRPSLHQRRRCRHPRG